MRERKEKEAVGDFLMDEIVDRSDPRIEEIVAIHRRELDRGFLSSLGRAALETLFSVAAVSRFGVLLVAQDADGKVLGFLLGTSDTRKFYREFLWKGGVRAFFRLLPKMVSFRTIYKLVEVLLYPRKKALQNLPAAELLDIAVSREHQGRGIARSLFHRFVSHLQERGLIEFRITTGEVLKGAQRFYERLGACKVGEVEVHKGEKTCVYVYRVGSGGESP